MTVLDGLRVTASGRLVLPPDIITQTIALLAIRGAGKSTAAADLAEEMYRLGLPFVGIDPKGDWWGLRSSADGTGPGLPIPVFGGLHGDMPLTAESGPLIAELIVRENLTCILDTSDFPSDAATARFLTDFGNALFRLHRASPAPRHLFLEEADEIVPQMVRPEMANCVHIWNRIFKQGRAFGLGGTLISQRSAAVNKNSLSQVMTLIAMRTTDTRDRKAIADWILQNNAGGKLLDSLAGLGDGEAWVVSPQWLVKHGQEAVQRIQFRQRKTFDSGATPTLATAARPPATLASIDLKAIAAQMTAVTEQAAKNDPALLRARISRLERDLRAGTGPALAALTAENASLQQQLTAALARPPEVIEVPVLQAGETAAAEQVVTALRDLAGQFSGHADEITAALAAATRATARSVPAPAAPAVSRRRPVPVPAAAPPGEGLDGTRPEGQPKLKAGARNMLVMLARSHPLQLTRTQLAGLARIKGSGSTFSSYLSSLRLAGYVTTSGNLVLLTPEGLAEAGGAADQPPMSAEEIRVQWRSVLKAGARSMLDNLLERYPDPVARTELAALAGINPAGSTLSSYLSTLRTNNLIEEDGDGIRAAAMFFLDPVRT